MSPRGTALRVLLGWAVAASVHAAEDPPLQVIGREALPASAIRPDPAVPPTHQLRLSLVVMRGTGWRPATVLEAAAQAATILAQCAIRTTAIELHEVEGPARFRNLYTPVSRELAHRLGLPRPAVFFVGETLHRPAFDAEAVGRGNSRTRPEMADTVWIASGARDLPQVIAHELAHVLADSGEHSAEPRNLMREDTGPDRTRLSEAQCRGIVATAAANGLLQKLAP